MIFRTRFTEQVGIDYPIVLAPMAGFSGGRLAAAVSNAGGLGLVGGGYGDSAWLRRELELVRGETDRPWGVGFITWHASEEVVELALSYQPKAVFLSFGDPCRYASRVKAAGALLICQVQEVAAALDAVAAGADLIVAQGSEAGGHGATRATLPLVPTVVDAVAPVPVLAAGGIVDGRGLAAALMLGAHGAVMGTRFLATQQSLMHPAAKERIVAADGSDTVRTRVFDPVRGYDWPEGFTVRALRNAHVARWHGREDALDAAIVEESERYAAAVAAGDFETVGIFAGEGVDLVREIMPAGELVRCIGTEAADRLREGPVLLS
jgi:nitronate monooxygenase